MVQEILQRHVGWLDSLHIMSHDDWWDRRAKVGGNWRYFSRLHLQRLREWAWISRPLGRYIQQVITIGIYRPEPQRKGIHVGVKRRKSSHYKERKRSSILVSMRPSSNPLNTAARDLWGIQVWSWQLSVMQTLKTFQWLQIALKITSNLNMVLKALKFLVPTYLSSTTFSLLSVLQTLWPSFHPLGLPCPLLPQGLCPDWEPCLSSFCLSAFCVSFSMQGPLLREGLYISLIEWINSSHYTLS